MEKNTLKKSDGFYQNGEAKLVVLSEFEFLETIGVGKKNFLLKKSFLKVFK